MTIGKKLFVWFLVPIILTIVLGTITFINSRKIDKNINTFIEEDWKRADSNMELRIGLGLLASSVSLHTENLIYKDIGDKNRAIESHEDAHKLIEIGKHKFMDGFQKLVELEKKGPEVFKLKYTTLEIKQKFDTMVEALEKIEEKYLSNNIVEALAIKSEEFDPYYKELQVIVLEKAEEFADAIVEASENKTTKITSISVTTVITMTIVIVIVGLVFSFIICRVISNPIIKLRDAAIKIGKGKLDTKIYVKSKDELGELANSFVQMSNDLKKTTVSKDYEDNILKSMIDTLIVVSSDATIKTVNQATLNLLGYTEDELLDKSIGIIFSKEEEFKETGINDLIKKGFIGNAEKTYLAKDGRKIPVLFSGSVMHNVDGEMQGIVCVAEDITELKRAGEQIKGSLREKEVLLQEIYHRVKNNMQIICSILNLQSRYIVDKKYIDIFKTCENRIKTMALIHEKLYQSKDLANIDFNTYIKNLLDELWYAYVDSTKKIKITRDIKDIQLGIDAAIPCGLIINELVSNSLKHAFPYGKEGEIKIIFHSTCENKKELIVSDNGIGISKDLDLVNTDSLGLKLVTILAQGQLDGNINLDRINGTTFKIKFEWPKK